MITAGLVGTPPLTTKLFIYPLLCRYISCDTSPSSPDLIGYTNRQNIEYTVAQLIHQQFG